MDLNEESLNKIAGLARIRIDESEINSALKDFNSILHYVDQVSQMDVSGITEQDLYQHKENIVRLDSVEPSLDRNTIEKFAPDFQNGYFVVPRVIEHD